MKTGIIFFWLLLSLTTVNAKVYKWVDEDGVTHYSQKAPEENAKEIKVKGVPSADENTPNRSTASMNKRLLTLDCNKAVRHGLMLMKEKFNKENSGVSKQKVAMLDDPRVIADGVADCNKDKSNPKEAAEWLCQQNARSFDEVLACEK